LHFPRLPEILPARFRSRVEIAGQIRLNFVLKLVLLPPKPDFRTLPSPHCWEMSLNNGGDGPTDAKMGETPRALVSTSRIVMRSAAGHDNRTVLRGESATTSGGAGGEMTTTQWLLAIPFDPGRAGVGGAAGAPATWCERGGRCREGVAQPAAGRADAPLG
jgi:hypothetical protein